MLPRRPDSSELTHVCQPAHYGFSYWEPPDAGGRCAPPVKQKGSAIRRQGDGLYLYSRTMVKFRYSSDDSRGPMVTNPFCLDPIEQRPLANGFDEALDIRGLFHCRIHRCI